LTAPRIGAGNVDSRHRPGSGNLVGVTESRSLQQLVDARRFDDLLREVSLADVATAWMRQHQNIGLTMEPETDPDWWAVEAWMDEQWWADEDRVRAGLLELVAAAETDDDYGVLGAAVMEVFVTDSNNRLAWLEARAAESEPFRRSLRNVYVWGQVPDGVAQRVEEAAGAPLPRPTHIADAATRAEVHKLRQAIERLGDNLRDNWTDRE
jgi:hypothetical protein